MQRFGEREWLDDGRHFCLEADFFYIVICYALYFAQTIGVFSAKSGLVGEIALLVISFVSQRVSVSAAAHNSPFMDTCTWFSAIASLAADFAWQEYWPPSVTSFSSPITRVPFEDNFCLWFTGNLVESDARLSMMWACCFVVSAQPCVCVCWGITRGGKRGGENLLTLKPGDLLDWPAANWAHDCQRAAGDSAHVWHWTNKWRPSDVEPAKVSQLADVVGGAALVEAAVYNWAMGKLQLC